MVFPGVIEEGYAVVNGFRAIRVASSMVAATAKVCPPIPSEETISPCRPSLRLGMLTAKASGSAPWLKAAPAPAIPTVFKKVVDFGRLNFHGGILYVVVLK